MKFREVKIKEYLCERCETPLNNHNGGGYVFNNNSAYCYECALRLELITKEYFNKHCGWGYCGRLQGEDEIYAERD